MCRKVNDLQGKHCQATERREVCMSLGDLADLYVEEGWGRRISPQEALEIARRNEEEGLVLMPGNQQEATFMCACCSDCCSMLGMMKFVPRPADVVASNYFDVGNDAGGAYNLGGGISVSGSNPRLEYLVVADNTCSGFGMSLPTNSTPSPWLLRRRMAGYREETSSHSFHTPKSRSLT